MSKLSDEIFAFVETYCRTPEGAGAGGPLVLQEWQKEIIRQIYDDERTRRVIISMARRNGKTTITAVIVLLHLIGPCAVANSSIFSAAQSREQASIVFALAAKMVRLNPKLHSLITVRDSRKELFCPRTGVTYRALSADASTAYGLSPIVCVHDELGQVDNERSELYEALESGMASHARPLSIVISTQAPSDRSLLSVLIDTALGEKNPATKLFLYTAPPELDPFAIETIRLANPALGTFVNEAEILALAADAKRLPTALAAFENLNLNRRVDRATPFMTQMLWASCNEPPRPLAAPAFAGLDLGSVADLTSYWAISQSDGKWNAHGRYWLPGDDLETKGRVDHFDYVAAAQQGLVTPCPGRTVSWAMVAEFLADEIRRGVKKIGFDRYRFADLRPHLLNAGVSEQQIAEIFVECGQGYVTQTRALDALERAVLDGNLRHGGHKVLTWNIANTTIVRDDAGNRKVTKAKAHGRIDGVVALAQAFFVAPLEPPAPDYQFFFIGGGGGSGPISHASDGALARAILGPGGR